MTRLLLALVLAAVGCGPKPSPQSGGRCPGEPPVACLTDTECVYDATRGCQVCRCKAAGAPASATPPGKSGPPTEP